MKNTVPVMSSESAVGGEVETSCSEKDFISKKWQKNESFAKGLYDDVFMSDFHESQL